MALFPKVIVFDLDYTLWPFWVDTHYVTPFKKTKFVPKLWKELKENNKSGVVVDASGRKISFYPEVPSILKKLKSDGIKIGIASRTSEIAGANQLIELFDWGKYISYKEIYPGNKVPHLSKIRKDSGVEFSEIIFFDDEPRNVRDVDKLGVLSVLVENGMSMGLLNNGFKRYQQRRSKSPSPK